MCPTVFQVPTRVPPDPDLLRKHGGKVIKELIA
jgi:hypothetical protein